MKQFVSMKPKTERLSFWVPDNHKTNWRAAIVTATDFLNSFRDVYQAEFSRGNFQSLDVFAYLTTNVIYYFFNVLWNITC